MKAKLVIEMPKACYCCILLIHYDGVACLGCIEKDYTGRFRPRKFHYGQSLDTRPDWCPLIPIEGEE